MKIREVHRIDSIHTIPLGSLCNPGCIPSSPLVKLESYPDKHLPVERLNWIGKWVIVTDYYSEASESFRSCVNLETGEAQWLHADYQVSLPESADLVITVPRVPHETNI